MVLDFLLFGVLVSSIFVIVRWNKCDHLFKIPISFDGTFYPIDYRLDYQFLDEILVFLWFPDALAILLGHGKAYFKLQVFCFIINLKMHVSVVSANCGCSSKQTKKKKGGFWYSQFFSCTIFLKNKINKLHLVAGLRFLFLSSTDPHMPKLVLAPLQWVMALSPLALWCCLFFIPRTLLAIVCVYTWHLFHSFVWMELLSRIWIFLVCVACFCYSQIMFIVII